MTTPIDRESVEQALAELEDVVRCRCSEAYKGRGLHDPDCQCDSAEAVATLRAALDAAEGENKRLREALHSIASNTCCDTCQEAALVARAALLGAKPLNERSSEATNWRSQSEEENIDG